MTAHPIWRLSPGAEFHRRVWGEECVLFNSESGDTHLLDSVAAFGLACFEASQHDTASLSRALCKEFDLEAGPLLTDYANRLIETLSSLGLIEIQKRDAEQSFP